MPISKRALTNILRSWEWGEEEGQELAKALSPVLLNLLVERLRFMFSGDDAALSLTVDLGYQNKTWKISATLSDLSCEPILQSINTYSLDELLEEMLGTYDADGDEIESLRQSLMRGVAKIDAERKTLVTT